MSSAKKDYPSTGINNIYKFFDLLIMTPVSEIIYGIKFKTIPITQVLAFSLISLLITFFQVDYYVYKNLNIEWLYPTGQAYTVYVISLNFTGLIMWSLVQTMLKVKLTKRLGEVFTNSGLKSMTGKLPDFIFDRPIDEFVRVLRVTRNSHPLKIFQNSKDYLESGLNVFVDEIKESRTSGTIDILYSHTELEKSFDNFTVESLPRDHFIVGKSRGPVLEVNLNEVPHLLIAGQTGGGKSTFLRQLITSLYLNNKDYDFNLVDLKGGLEFQTFEGHERISVFSTVESALMKMNNLANHEIERRKAILKEHKCKDVESLRKYYLSLDAKDKSNKIVKLKRNIFVIDEAFELFMAGAFAKAKEAQEARRNASKIAAQGRAVGVHLIIATQRPDRFAIDPQTKANLPGVLTFPLPNQASSRTVLDNARACDLPNIKGRGLWKCGGKMVEVQTPNFSEQEAAKLLRPFLLKSNTQIKSIQVESVDDNVFN